MRVPIKALTIAALLLPLSACGDGGDELDVTEHHLKLDDGRTVHCIETVRIGSWSCDWENAK